MLFFIQIQLKLIDITEDWYLMYITCWAKANPAIIKQNDSVTFGSWKILRVNDANRDEGLRFSPLENRTRATVAECTSYNAATDPTSRR